MSDVLNVETVGTVPAVSAISLPGTLLLPSPKIRPTWLVIAPVDVLQLTAAALVSRVPVGGGGNDTGQVPARNSPS